MYRELSLGGNPSFEVFPFYPKSELEERLSYTGPIDSSHIEDEAPLDWRDAASCAQIGSDDTFFPGKGASTYIQKIICSRCYVEEECTRLSLENPAEYGLWGGKSEHDRRALLKDKKKIA